MSLILEALKKSEQQRRLGELPTLATPAPLARRRRSALPWLALAIALALVAGWWFGREPAAPPAPAVAQVPGDAVAEKAPPGGGDAVAAADPGAAGRPPRRGSRRPLQAGADGMGEVMVAMPKGEEKDRPGAASVPPGGVLVPDPGDATVTGLDLGGGAEETVADDTPVRGWRRAAESRRAAAADATSAAEAGKEAPAAGGRADVAAPAGSEAAAAERAAAQPAPAAPGKPKPERLPYSWELPYAVRRDLPPITLTMHVYDAAPELRFAVVNGERCVEGDTIGHCQDGEAADGLRLEEITPEGIVFTFQGRRFLYSRDGR